MVVDADKVHCKGRVWRTLANGAKLEQGVARKYPFLEAQRGACNEHSYPQKRTKRVIVAGGSQD